MSEPGPRVAAWLTTVSDLLRQQLTEMPHQVVMEQLHLTFRVNGVGHSSSDASGRQIMQSVPVDLLAPVVELDEWRSSRAQDHHPLMRWHAVTGDLRPTTMEHVPTQLVPSRLRRPIVAALARYGLERQIAIHYRLTGRAHDNYVLARDGADFTDDDLVVARYVQRAVLGLERQVALVQQLGHRVGPAFDAGLTGRETSVLVLLATGEPTRGIAQRLGCSPRTVDKHLERIFRKLGVRDRLNAVRVAREWNLL